MEERKVGGADVVEVDFGVFPRVVVFGDVLRVAVRVVHLVPRHVEAHGHVGHLRRVQHIPLRVCAQTNKPT